MLKNQLARIDLNLLTAFVVLMEEQSVTRAADRLFLSQPAMSAKLHRLRELFNDPLFVRTQKGYVPTLKAHELVAPIESALAQLSGAIFSGEFDPLLAKDTINIQVPDSLSIALIPKLYKKMRELAPHIQISSDNTTQDYLDLLAKGEIDFAVYAEENYTADFVAFPIGHTPVVCWMRRGHPLESELLPSIQQIISFPLVMLTYERSKTSEITTLSRLEHLMRNLYETGNYMDIACLRTSQLLTAIATIQDTNALLLTTPFLANVRDHQQRLVYKVVRETSDQLIPIALIQHQRTANSPLHIWLRNQLLDSWTGETENAVSMG